MRGIATLGLLAVLVAASGCANDSSSARALTPDTSQPEQPGSTDPESFDASLRYYGNNLFAAGEFAAAPEECDDPFDGGAAGNVVEYFDAVSPESCFQDGAMAVTPPAFDCADGIDPEAPDERDAIAGVRVVFDIRSLEVVVASHVIAECIPIG